MFEFECVCGSNICTQLGVLGTRVHLRCRACGQDSSVTVEEFMEGEEGEEDENFEEDGEYMADRDPDREDFHAD